jgi:hypothetical protein
MLTTALSFFVLSFVSFLFLTNRWTSMSIESGQAFVGGFLVLGLIALGSYYYTNRKTRVSAKTF